MHIGIRVAYRLAFLFLAARPVHAQLPPIELTAVAPAGCQAGATVELQVAAGNRLDEVDRLWFSHPAITAEVLTEPDRPYSEQPRPRYGHFRVSVPDDVAPGRYEVRAIGRFGISNPRVFRVTGSPRAEDAETRHALEQPSGLALDRVIHGRATAGEIDFYAIELDRGEQVSARLFAQRLDARMIGQLTWTDSSGERLQTQRGADHVDPELNFVAPARGRYRLCVHDVLFRGGEEFGYQLEATLGEWSDDQAAAAHQIPPHDRPEAFSLPDAASQAFHPIDESEMPHEVELPSHVASAFDSPFDVDRYEFELDAEQTLAIEVASSRLGEPSDPVWTLERKPGEVNGGADWQPVQTQDDAAAGGGDAAVDLNCRDPQGLTPSLQPGRYRLNVSDLDTGDTLSGVNRYRLSIGPPRPDFYLVAYPAFPHKDLNQAGPRGSLIPRGGTTAFRVFAVRSGGWSGPIRVTCEGLPAGVTARPLTIAAGRSAVQTTLSAGDDIATTRFEPRIVGKAMIGGQELTRDAVPAEIIWGRSDARQFIRSRLVTRLAAATSADDVAPLSVAVGEGRPVDITRGQSESLPIRLTRRDGGASPCVLRPQDLPPGVKVGEVNIAADKSDGSVTLNIEADASPGEYSFWFQTETKIKFRPNPQALARAEERLRMLEQRRKESAADEDGGKPAIDQAIEAAKQEVERAKAASQPQELTVYLPSHPVNLRIVDSQ